jgi:hypothetical protein
MYASQPVPVQADELLLDELLLDELLLDELLLDELLLEPQSQSTASLQTEGQF